MNKRGQTWAYALMLSVVVIILALALAPAGNQVIGQAMNSSTANFIGLDCDNSSISNFEKGTCNILDFSLPYFFGGLILIGGGLILARITFD